MTRTVSLDRARESMRGLVVGCFGVLFNALLGVLNAVWNEVGGAV